MHLQCFFPLFKNIGQESMALLDLFYFHINPIFLTFISVFPSLFINYDCLFSIICYLGINPLINRLEKYPFTKFYKVLFNNLKLD